MWVDNEVGDPSSDGNDLDSFANGIWSSDGTTATIVVDKDDVIAAYATSSLPSAPADTANWSDRTLTVSIALGRPTARPPRRDRRSRESGALPGRSVGGPSPAQQAEQQDAAREPEPEARLRYVADLEVVEPRGVETLSREPNRADRLASI